MRFKKPVVALSTVTLLALAACGGGGGDDGGSGGDSGGVDSENLANTGEAQDPDREGPVTIEGAEDGGTVTVLTETGLTTTFDPTENYYSDMLTIAQALTHRSLTQYAYDPESGQQVLVPDLATDLGTPNEDYTEWTFTLRDGVKWETGDPVTPEEVAFGINRSMDDATFPEGAGPYYSTPFFLGADKYQGPYSTKGGSADNPITESDAVTIKGRDITVHMSRPFQDYPYYAAFPNQGPIPLDPEISDPATYRQHPLSTGPYKIEKYTPSKEMILVRNEEWDPATDPARTQYPERYEFNAGVPSAQIDQTLLADTGDGQTTLTIDDVAAKNFRKFQTDYADRLVVGGSPVSWYFAPDYRTVPMEVREALFWAIPYEDFILAAALVPEVNAIPSTQMMPPGLPGREEFNMMPDHEAWKTDAEKAKQILADSGNSGYEIKFLWRTDNADQVKVKDVMVKGLTEAGFKATPVATTESKYSADRDSLKTDINLRFYGWGSDWPSGASWIPPLLGTNPSKTSIGTNAMVFSEPSVDKQIDEILAMPAEEQGPAWGEMEKEVMDKYLPIVPVYFAGVAMAHGSRIQGMNNDAQNGEPTYKDIWVSSE